MTFVGRWVPSRQEAHIVELTPERVLRSVARENGTVIIIGDCLASEEKLADAIDAMLRSNGFSAAVELPGCYSIAMIRRSGIQLLTDPIGQFPLFIAREKTELWFGYRASDIARRVGSRFNPVSAAITLVCPDSLDLSPHRSMFYGVQQMTEGHVITINETGINEQEDRTFRTDSRVTFADAARNLRAALSESISSRVIFADRLTSDLSGGLDSTSLAFLAARDTNLSVLTSYNQDARVEDDIQRARRYTLAAPGLQQHMVPLPPDQLPFQTIGPAGEVPHGSSVAMGALRSRLAMASKLGSDLHLVGEGGDVVVGAPPAYLADLARHNEFARLWRHCVAWGRLRDRPPIELFRRALILNATPRKRALHALARSISHAISPGEPSWESDLIGYWPRPYPHWLTRRIRGLVAERIHDTADRLADDNLDAGDVVTLGQLHQQALTQQVVRDTAVEMGSAVHAPFLDRRVVRACMSIPAHRRADPSVAKPLLRTALTGLVPETVLTRRTKGDYTRDAYKGVRRAASSLRRLLGESAAADHGVIEPGPVRDALERAIIGLPTPWGQLNQALAIEMWVRRHEDSGHT